VIWRDIPGLEGRYQASRAGQIRSARTRRVLRPGVCLNAYLMLVLGGKACRVHRLVASTFLPNPDGKPHVNHKNGVRADNRAVNLEWVTPSENHLHAHRALPRKQHSKTRAVMLVGPEGTRAFESLSVAAEAVGVVDGSMASAALRGHKCKGYSVQYV